jgi:hypothetical protein
MSERIGVINRALKRKVAIRPDGDDFVISFLPEDTVVFRHAEARALRKACVFLRWEVVSDTIPEASNQPLGKRPRKES